MVITISIGEEETLEENERKKLSDLSTTKKNTKGSLYSRVIL
jgi:hypothetical protein